MTEKQTQRLFDKSLQLTAKMLNVDLCDVLKTTRKREIVDVRNIVTMVMTSNGLMHKDVARLMDIDNVSTITKLCKRHYTRLNKCNTYYRVNKKVREHLACN